MTQLSFLPDSSSEIHDQPVNVASVPQRSPFRYPGGKTWLVPLFRRWIESLPTLPFVLVEPFAGGGIISLTTAFESLAKRIVMVELDHRVAAAWRIIFSGGANALADRILRFELSADAIRAETQRANPTELDLAFQTILHNRTAHGGIMAEGAGVLKHGENGKGLASRWYPQTIARRLNDIAQIADRVTFIEGDAFTVIHSHMESAETVFFIDPPYTAGGKRAGARLYTHSKIDHVRLFSVCEQLTGAFLLTYDNAPEVRALADKHGFQSRAVAMKNTHHAQMTELLISRDLSWLD